MDSSPKRVTRARVAANGVKTTKIVTAGFMAGTRSTAAKRKTREDEKDEDMERREALAKRPRGLQKSAVEGKGTGTRGRPKKVSVDDGKGARGMVTKGATGAKATTTGPATKSTTTASTGAATKATTKATTNVASKHLAKKAVSFQEGDKENVEPTPKEPAATGIRGRPARRGGAAVTRTTTRTTGKSTTTTISTTSIKDAGEKKPLSPRKLNQVILPRDDCDDEMILEKTPTKPMMKSPIKPPTTKKTDVFDTAAVSSVTLSPPDATNVFHGSPVRPPNTSLAETLKSPAKRIGALTVPGSALKPMPKQTGQTSLMTKLLQSAAKRPQSPVKGLGLPLGQNPQSTESVSKPCMFQSPAKRAVPGLKSLEPVTGGFSEPDANSLSQNPWGLSSSKPIKFGKPSEKLLEDSDMSEDADRDVFTGPMKGLLFSGRSALPRHPDSLFGQTATVEEEDQEAVEAQNSPGGRKMKEEQTVGSDDGLEEVELHGEELHDEELHGEEFHNEKHQLEELQDEERRDEEPQDADETMDESEDPTTLAEENEEALDAIGESIQEASKETPLRNPLYQLRDKDQDPCHDMSTISSDSDEETFLANNMTGTPTITGAVIPRSVSIARSVSKSGRRSSLGFSSLADQLGSWSAASPVKAPRPTRRARFAATEEDEAGEGTKEDTSADSTNAQSDTSTEETCEAQKSQLDKVKITDEDMALALEANEMSLLDSKPREEAVNPHRSFDDGASDASQEYGDENQAPASPVRASVEIVVPVTPARPMMRSFHTTTKIPLKAADDSSPSPLKKRSFSASRPASKRSSNLSKGSTAISTSPTKDRRRTPRKSLAGREDGGPATPAGPSNAWLTAETPGRTPRKDLNPALLRGAIVFVDVHTSEGADASGIFVELLTQMGARCVKSWQWNPSSPPGGGATSNKVGITHVVFKDGGKRTLEKVREAKGVVQCVGVSWVLDCERENEWLDESSYGIDTSNVPRGGARRRKSMEPKALTNMNGTLVSSPNKSGRESLGGPTTPKRRQSTIWMHTPTESGEEEEAEEDIEWSKLLLTPVPKTPAPEAIARFAAEDNEDEEDEEDEDVAPLREEMLMRTCPPKHKFREAGGSILGRGGQEEGQDEHVLVRLMAARRKSLQFAPKIGSPLAKMWR